MEPLTDIEQPVRARRNRRRRRLIDAEISIPVEVFKAQQEHYTDTLRVEVSYKRLTCYEGKICNKGDVCLFLLVIFFFGLNNHCADCRS